MLEVQIPFSVMEDMLVFLQVASGNSIVFQTERQFGG